MSSSTTQQITPALEPPFTVDSAPSASSPEKPSGDAASSDIISLPTIAGPNNHSFLVEDDIEKFLKDDLDLSRLNAIHDQLWAAGRPMRARPLHRYKMLGWEVVHTQQMDLHLLRYSNIIMIKPLPEYLLSHTFWTTYICPSADLHASALGFLLSYVWLIVSPLDLQKAQDLFLVPSYVTWPAWKAFVRSFTKHVDINRLHGVNQRYHFGDLRLGRVNSIYRLRFMSKHFVRGYLYSYNRYVAYFQRNFSWMLVVCVFFSLVLSAMQVGVSVSPLEENKAFIKSTYGFVVFSIVLVGAVLAFVGVMFTAIFFVNMGLAITHDNRMRKERGRLVEEGKDA
ncbi:hypothetical protein M011DRAFT_254337 [Sporormia fimetaria CBS 119925]|uniref:Uncharacterized protein n=1 Tax=Sporormia fimetaria CBS 119925 TaxID=1340428 RepID=A0A6A6UZE3_9PLEO|nr:hypothetical protein M011DRAFT_254337 [Sporormia fimetaria CBS 119925]